MITIKAPGKLMIAGEWSVLENDHPCIVTAVDKFVECRLEEDEVISIKIPNVNEVKYEFEKDKLRTLRGVVGKDKYEIRFVKNTVELFLKYMAENANPIKGFKITTETKGSVVKITENGKDEDKTEEKKEKIHVVGFGTSAAVCVAVGTAIMAFYDYDINDEKIKEVIFKLCAIAHFISQEFKGSGFDVAASVYGGTLMYKRFDELWLTNELKSNHSMQEILDGDWPYLKIKQIKLPKDMKLNVCWTKKTSKTQTMVAEMEKYKDNSYDEYVDLMEEFKLTVLSILDVMEQNNKKEIRYMLAQNMTLLNELNSKSGVNIVTSNLRKMIEIGEENDCATKISGAGGGDCGFSVCFDDETAKKIDKEWKEADLYPLDVNVEEKGVRKV